MIGDRFGDLDKGLASRDHRGMRKKIETDPKVGKWFSDLSSGLLGMRLVARYYKTH